jgi:hypothetical protein
MNPNLAEENLQTIRLLMERSAVYRRALAPIMLLAGLFGLLAAGLGLYLHLEDPIPFAALWCGTACVVLTVAFLLVRRQAIQDHEPFWSPPTYRVGQALLPPLLSGLCLGTLLGIPGGDWHQDFLMTLSWLFFYGCALHSAGFFILRGIKWLGWLFIAGTLVLMIFLKVANYSVGPATAHLVMGFFFGGLQVACGIYLYFTEKRIALA